MITPPPTWLAKQYGKDLPAVFTALGAKTEFTPDNKLMIEIDGVNYLLRSTEEFEILLSIYCYGEYNIVLPYDFIFVDIGMNIGITSLFFAAKPNVKKVIGFEPLPATYRCLLDNLNLNPGLAGKISAHNFGLAGTTRSQLVEYCFEYKGGVGILGLPADIKAQSAYHTEEIQLRDAGEALREIVSAFPGENIVLKIDCEGAEYEFFRNGLFLELLDVCTVVMLEYHRLGYEAIKLPLEEKGYQVQVVENALGINGMLYAARQ